MKYGNRRTENRILSSPITIVGLTILIIILARATWSIREKSVASANKLSQAKSELAKLEDHQADIGQQVNHLSTEQGIEAELRTKYRAVKTGESVAVIVDNSQTASNSPIGRASTSSSLTASFDGSESVAAASQASSTPLLGWFSRLLRSLGF